MLDFKVSNDLQNICRSHFDFTSFRTGKAKPKEIEHTFSTEFPGINCQMSYGALHHAFEQEVTKTLSTIPGCLNSNACKLKEVTVPACGWSANQRTRRSITDAMKILFSLRVRAIDSSSRTDDIDEKSEAIMFQMQYTVSTGQFRISLPGMNSTAVRSSFQHHSINITCNPGFVKSIDRKGCGE